jgi:glycosyltransferase 2 family protein
LGVKLDKKLLSRGLSALVAAGIILAAIELARRFQAGAVRVDPLWLGISTLCLALGYLGQASGVCRMIANAASERPAPALAYELFFRGMLARYLPGRVGIPAVRMANAASLGVGPAFMAASVMLESLAWLASGLLLTVVLSLGPWAPPHMSQLWDHGLAKLAVGVALLGAALLALVDSRFYPVRLMRFLRLEGRKGPLLPPLLMLACGSFWSANAASSAALAVALGGGPDTALLAAAAGMAAQLAGFLALPVPAGLGVREGLLLMALSSSLGASGALAFGLFSRAIALGTEVLLWLMSRLFVLRLARSQAQAARSFPPAA